MADTQFHGLGTENAPADWTLPGSLDLVLKAARAVYDGTSAAGAFLPCLTILSDSGNIVGQYVTGSTVAAGDAADVSFGPFLRGASASTGIMMDTDTGGNIGEWLYVETDGPAMPPGDGAWGVEFRDLSTAGFDITSLDANSETNEFTLSGGSRTGYGAVLTAAGGIFIAMQDSEAGSGMNDGITIQNGAGAAGVTINDSTSDTGTAGVNVESSAGPVNLTAGSEINLTAHTTGGKINFMQGSTTVLQVDLTTTPATYHILSGASWVSDL